MILVNGLETSRMCVSCKLLSKRMEQAISICVLRNNLPSLTHCDMIPAQMDISIMITVVRSSRRLRVTSRHSVRFIILCNPKFSSTILVIFISRFILQVSIMHSVRLISLVAIHLEAFPLLMIKDRIPVICFKVNKLCLTSSRLLRRIKWRRIRINNSSKIHVNNINNRHYTNRINNTSMKTRSSSLLIQRRCNSSSSSNSSNSHNSNRSPILSFCCVKDCKVMLTISNFETQ